MRTAAALKTLYYTPNHDLRIFQKRNLFVFIGFLAFWLLCLCNPINNITGFDQEDDHIIAGMTRGYRNGDSITDQLEVELRSDVGMRFRPIWVAYRLIEVKAFGTNYAAYSVLNTVVLSISSFILYLIVSYLPFTFFSRICISVAVFWGPQLQGYIWRAPQEPLAVLFMLCSLYLLTRSCFERKSAVLLLLSMLFAFFMCLTKESFAMLLPAFIVWRLGLLISYRDLRLFTAVRRSVWWILAFTAVFVIAIGLILTYAGTSMGYAGIDAETKYAKYIDSAGSLFKTVPGILFGVSILLSVFISKKEPRRPGVKPLCICSFMLLLTITWVLPQIVLFAKSGFYPRYLLPAVLSFWISVYAAMNLANKFSPSVYNQIRFFVVIGFLWLSYSNYEFLSGYGQWRQNWTDVVKDVKEHTNRKSTVLVIVDPSLDYGYAKCMYDFLTGYLQLGEDNVHIYFDPPPPYTNDTESREHKTGVLGPLYRRHVVTNVQEFTSYTLIAAPRYQAEKSSFAEKYKAALKDRTISSGQKFVHFYKKSN